MASNVEATLRKTVNTMTDFLFPVSKEALEKNQHNLLRSGHEYISSLPFQVSLYFNAWFSPFWFVSTIAVLAVKLSFTIRVALMLMPIKGESHFDPMGIEIYCFVSLTILYKIILIAAYIMFGIIEIIRLYLGYLGNLMERVPELAGSWLLTILMQFPLILFLLFNEEQKIFPLERAVHIVMLVFIVFEMFFGYFAIRTMVNYQMTQFHLRQFADLEHINGHGNGQNTYKI